MRLKLPKGRLLKVGQADAFVQIKVIIDGTTHREVYSPMEFVDYQCEVDVDMPADLVHLSRWQKIKWALGI